MHVEPSRTAQRTPEVMRIPLQSCSVNFWFRDWCGPLQKIEVASFVCLLDVLHEKFAVPPRENSCSRSPGGSPASQLHLGHLHVQRTGGYVEFDEVTLVQQSERTTHERFGCDMKNTSSVIGSAHSRVRNADHIAHSCLQ